VKLGKKSCKPSALYSGGTVLMQRWQKQADGNLLRTIGNFRVIVHSNPNTIHLSKNSVHLKSPVDKNPSVFNI
jgi:hypothetical protein